MNLQEKVCGVSTKIAVFNINNGTLSVVGLRVGNSGAFFSFLLSSRRTDAAINARERRQVKKKGRERNNAHGRNAAGQGFDGNFGLRAGRIASERCQWQYARKKVSDLVCWPPELHE